MSSASGSGSVGDAEFNVRELRPELAWAPLEGASMTDPISLYPFRFQHMRNKLPDKTVVEIKGIVRDLCTKTRTRIAVSGAKQALINRVQEQLDSWRAAGKIEYIREYVRLVDLPRDRSGNVLGSLGGNGYSTATNGGASASQIASASHYAASSAAAIAGPSGHGTINGVPVNKYGSSYQPHRIAAVPARPSGSMRELQTIRVAYSRVPKMED